MLASGLQVLSGQRVATAILDDRVARTPLSFSGHQKRSRELTSSSCQLQGGPSVHPGLSCQGIQGTQNHTVVEAVLQKRCCFATALTHSHPTAILQQSLAWQNNKNGLAIRWSSVPDLRSETDSGNFCARSQAAATGCKQSYLRS